MPKLVRGVYVKHGYPLEIDVYGEMFVYKASGATRMVYQSTRNDNVVAKVMPGQASTIWQPTWTERLRGFLSA